MSYLADARLFRISGWPCFRMRTCLPSASLPYFHPGGNPRWLSGNGIYSFFPSIDGDTLSSTNGDTLFRWLDAFPPFRPVPTAVLLLISWAGAPDRREGVSRPKEGARQAFQRLGAGEPSWPPIQPRPNRLGRRPRPAEALPFCD